MRRLARALLLALLVMGPLAFGAVEVWSQGLLLIVASLGLLLYGLGGTRVMAVPLMIPLAAFLLYIALQLIPLPGWMLGILSPGAREAYGLIPSDGWALGRLSVAPGATYAELMRYTAYAAVFVLSALTVKNRQWLLRAMYTVAFTAGGIALIGIIQKYVSPSMILFVREAPSGAEPFGPFVNRNHFAGLMGMALPVTLALLFYAEPQVSGDSRYRRIVRRLAHPGAPLYLLLLFAACMISVGVLVSLSRGGMLTLVAVTALFALMTVRGARGMLVVSIIAAAAIGLMWYWTGWGLLIERVTAGRSDAMSRVSLWKDTLGIIGDYALTGTGLGAYADVYPGYKSFPGQVSPEHAHNDYLEYLGTAGVAGTALLAWIVAGAARISISAMRRLQGGRRVLMAGLIAGASAPLFHALVDFNLQVGSNGMYFFALMGLAVGAASVWADEAGDKRADEGGWGGRVTVASAVLLAWAIVSVYALEASASHLRAVRAMRPTASSDAGLIRAAYARAEIGRRLDPLGADIAYEAARLKMLMEGLGAASGAIERALRLAPLSAERLQAYGLVLSGVGRDEEARAMMEAGVRRDPTNPVRLEVSASWLLSRGYAEEGLARLAELISLQPQLTRRYLALVYLHGLGDDEAQRAIPISARPRALFADYLYEADEVEAAEREYVRAMGLSSQDEENPEAYYHRAFQFYLKTGRKDKALDAVMKGIERYEDRDNRLRMDAASVYLGVGLLDRAAEIYEEVLDRSPEYKPAANMLMEVQRRRR